MHAHHTVVHLAAVPIPLPTDAHGVVATLGRAGLVHTTNGLGMGMISGDDLLAPVSELFFVPLDRFEEPL
jgi:hypothetical protein